MFENVKLKPRGWYPKNAECYKRYIAECVVNVKGRRLEDGELWIYTLLLPDGSKVEQCECEKRFIPFNTPIKCKVYAVVAFLFGGTFLYFDIFKQYSGGAK